MTVHDKAAQKYIMGEIVTVGGVSEAQFIHYATNAGLGQTMYTIFKTGRPADDNNTSDDADYVREVSASPAGDYGEPGVSAVIARLHNEGWTMRLVAEIWERWSDFAEARGLPPPEGGKADLAGEEHPEPEKMCLKSRNLCSAGAAAGAMIGLFEACVYAIPWTWLRDHPATCGIQVAAGVFILVAMLGWFVPPWRKYAWGTLLVGLGLLILSRL